MNLTKPGARRVGRVRPPETVVMFILASIWLFRQLCEIAHHFLFGVPGGTQIIEVASEAGNVLIAVTEGEAREQVHDLCHVPAAD